MPRGILLKNNLTKETLLKIAALGILTLPALTSPHFLSQIVNKYFKEKNNKRVRALRELEKKKIIDINELKDGSIKITLTQFGKKSVLQYKLEDMELTRPEKWDGYWRIIIYDIPKKMQKASNAFRMKIRDLGLYQLQKSIWVSPFDCIKELDFLCTIFEIPLEDCVLYFKTKELPKENKIKRFFNL
jgi:DNA-binding transcriptional regulator PaaX